MPEKLFSSGRIRKAVYDTASQQLDLHWDNQSVLAYKHVPEEVFRRLRKSHRAGYFNEIFGRTDLNNPSSLLEGLGYNDGLLLAMLMDPGQMTMTWAMEKTHALRDGQIILPGMKLAVTCPACGRSMPSRRNRGATRSSTGPWLRL